MHIGLNAHLLAGEPSFRSAGIHQYIHNLLAHLPAAAPPDWRFSALVGSGYRLDYERVEMRRSRMDTGSPARRILWEQLIQPWQLGAFDLYHALAFAGPLVLRRPMVVTVYDLSFVHYPGRLSAMRRLYLRLLTGITCRRARRVIAISRSTADDVARQYGVPRERIDVAAPGHDATHFRPLDGDVVRAFKDAHGLFERFLLFIGTLEPRKNLVVLLEAYASLPAALRLPLVIGGAKGWQYEPIFDAVERLGLQRDVRFAGFIPSEDLPFWYNSASAFVYPSVFEGFGLPVLEAMACGTPVVVSDASSLPEVVGETGLRVPPDDREAWREALRRASEDEAWREAARVGGLRHAARFTWESTAAQTVASYMRCRDNWTL